MVWAAIQEGLDKIDEAYVDYLRWVVNNTTMQFIPAAGTAANMRLANERVKSLRKEAVSELVRRVEEYIPRP